MASILRSIRFSHVLAAHRMGKLQMVVVSQAAGVHSREGIGSREVVGHGLTGNYEYFDCFDQPYPAIRFREENDEIKKLREKEKGDWKSLSLEEKRKLYRFNFCLTMSEINPPNAEWKIQLSVVFMCVSMALVFITIAQKYFYGPLPDTMSPEGKQRTRDIQLLYKTNPIFGVSSKWDYEKNEWKK